MGLRARGVRTESGGLMGGKLRTQQERGRNEIATAFRVSDGGAGASSTTGIPDSFAALGLKKPFVKTGLPRLGNRQTTQGVSGFSYVQLAFRGFKGS